MTILQVMPRYQGRYDVLNEWGQLLATLGTKRAAKKFVASCQQLAWQFRDEAYRKHQSWQPKRRLS
jgi:hypothetical protein